MGALVPASDSRRYFEAYAGSVLNNDHAHTKDNNRAVLNNIPHPYLIRSTTNDSPLFEIQNLKKQCYSISYGKFN